MRILLSNDDGIGAEGLEALHAALSALGEVWVVAPDREQSAASHAITLDRPLRIKERRPRWYSVDGTPTDCVFLALNHLMRDAPPGVLCSGINNGPNLGNDVIYSGTVAAAREGALSGVSAVALSQAGKVADLSHAARFAAQLVGVVARHPLPRGTLLNVNFPPQATVRYAFTRLGRRNYGAAVVEKLDPRGRHYYWIGGDEARHEDLAGSDCNAVFDGGLISITPINLDMTDHRVLETGCDWDVAGFERARPT